MLKTEGKLAWTDAYTMDSEDLTVLVNRSLAYSKNKDLKAALAVINECLSVIPKYCKAKDLQQRQLKLSK